MFHGTAWQGAVCSLGPTSLTTLTADSEWQEPGNQTGQDGLDTRPRHWSPIPRAAHWPQQADGRQGPSGGTV